MANISFHGSHNGALVVEDKGEILCVIEVERFINQKNIGIAQYYPAKHIMITVEEIMKWVEREYGISEFENCYFACSDFIGEDFDGVHQAFQTNKLINAKNYIHGLHHEAHANGVFYQSSFNKALIFSFDGGGDDGKFNVYIGDRKKGVSRIGQHFNPNEKYKHKYYDLGFPYMIFAHYLHDINFTDVSAGNLIYPGKLMGLVSYGKVKDEWIKDFIDFYNSDPDGGNEDFDKKIKKLGKKINVKFDINNRLKGQLAYDIAATAQRAFEECFFKLAKPYFDKYPDLPICITGGCGLNIILNTRVVEKFSKEVFVGPNPNDCGIALGLLLKHMKPKKPVDVTYKGLPVLDKGILPEYMNNKSFVRKLMKKDDYYHPVEQFENNIILKDLNKGKIIGVVRGQSEHGPRALGNRSILCNPSIPEMKDILNSKVKHREWYRPFAPVVRLEDLNKYFDWSLESRWMTFCPKVKKEWRKKLAAITHIDNTARVQTVTKEQNEWLYNLLTAFEKESGIGVLLNTSFNVNGKPILSTYKDAFHIFDNEELDCLILEEYYIRKEPFKDGK
tara:strand:+ start:1639 stop:3321 length:1683 start_codon:yes stop_codon:yes gene_type:complete